MANRVDERQKHQKESNVDHQSIEKIIDGRSLEMRLTSILHQLSNIFMLRCDVKLGYKFVVSII